MIGNRILCRECVARLYPKGVEQKTCTHGCRQVDCTECGKRRKPDDPYWACLGEMPSEGDK